MVVQVRAGAVDAHRERELREDLAEILREGVEAPLQRRPTDHGRSES